MAISRVTISGTDLQALNLQPQEDFFAVKKMTEPDAEGQSHERDHQVSEAGGNSIVEKFFHVAACETQPQPLEADDVVGQVNRDRVRSDPYQRLHHFWNFHTSTTR